jgi:hypothetical protein
LINDKTCKPNPCPRFQYVDAVLDDTVERIFVGKNCPGEGPAGTKKKEKSNIVTYRGANA